MFAVGDKILYPMHGAGVIQDIEEEEVLGEIKQYYVLDLSYVNMRVMIPVAGSADIGVRPIIAADKVPSVIGILSAIATEMDNNWNRRYRENAFKLKTGDIDKTAEVVRNLTRSEAEKRLSAGEKKMLSSARQILISELCLATGNDFGEVESMVDSAI